MQLLKNQQDLLGGEYFLACRISDGCTDDGEVMSGFVLQTGARWFRRPAARQFWL